MDTSADLIVFAIGLAVVLTIFLIFRAIVLWYWKIDRVVSLLEKIEENTRRES